MKFSIGIPAYKASYLKECIDSVLSQTYQEFEVIIVNDASPENIDTIISDYDSRHIRYYKNDQNLGAANVVDNWNKCLSLASGNFFILMGDDDKLEPNYLEEFLKLILQYPSCHVYHCRSIIINEKSNVVSVTEPRPEFESVYDSVLQRIKGHRSSFISDHVFRTETLKNNGGFYKLPLAWGSDDISAYIAAQTYGTAHTNFAVFNYRQNCQSITSSGNVFLKLDAILEEEKWLSNFLKKSPDFTIDILLQGCIKKEIKKYIQKKKILTIFSSNTHDKGILFLKAFISRKKYNLSIEELLYAILVQLKNRKMKKRI